MHAEAEGIAKKFGLKLTWMDRWSVRYDQMPDLLSKYAYYIDLRRPPGHIEARSVGKAALEALACGCRVIDWSGKIIEGLPEQNEPVRVAAKWNDVYVGLLRKA
jgi:hypothetical protein